MARVLVTGANGFIGVHLCRHLAARGDGVVAGVRRAGTAPGGAAERVIGNVEDSGAFRGALSGVEVVVHLAAAVPGRTARGKDTESGSFERVNREASRNLAEQMGLAGVRRLIFLSTVKVGGDRTHGAPLVEGDPARPGDAYARSKWEAEQLLGRMSSEHGFELVVVRPPLTYGPGVGGNLLRLLQWVHRGIPLPLASVHNRRSLVSSANLCDFVHLCMHHHAAAGETFYVSDQHDLSTPELVRLLARGLGRPARLLRFPVRGLAALGTLAGGADRARSLLDSLQVDSGKASRLLGWQPKLGVERGLAQMARWYSQQLVEGRRDR